MDRKENKKAKDLITMNKIVAQKKKSIEKSIAIDFPKSPLHAIVGQQIQHPKVGPAITPTPRARAARPSKRAEAPTIAARR